MARTTQRPAASKVFSTCLLLSGLMVLSPTLFAAKQCPAKAAIVGGVAKANGYRVSCKVTRKSKLPINGGECKAVGTTALLSNTSVAQPADVLFHLFLFTNKTLKAGWKITRVDPVEPQAKVHISGTGERGVSFSYFSKKPGERKQIGVKRFIFLSPDDDCGPRGDGWREAFTGSPVR